MHELRIHVLGGLDLELAGAGAPLDLPTRKSRAFLAYLALSPGMTRSREHLAGTFWHRSAEEQARASLRQTLSSLRRAFPAGPAMIGSDADCVWLDAGALRVDALQFDQLAADRSAPSLESAVALYRGELLGGFSLREEPFEQWAAAERRRYHERAVQALSDLVGHYTRNGTHERALALAERLVALDPLLEWAHCALIRLYLRAGRRGAALRQYQECARLLQQELGIAPARETQQLAEQIGRASAGASALPRVYEPAGEGADLARLPPVLPAERKQLTVLRARIRLAIEDLDPEAAIERLDPALRAMTDVVARFGGTVSQVRDDGVTALFGAPVALEDHAVRACYAALAMRDAMAMFAPAPDVRIGVHSGEAVVRTVGDEHSRHYDAVGQAPRFAGLIDAGLAAGEIAITAETAQRAQGFVQARDPVALSLEGVPEPVTILKLQAKAQLRLRWQARSAQELTQFVGREAEIARLADLLERAANGAGQVAVVVGEPGMGKSRLVHEFVNSTRVQGCTVLETGTSPHETSATYLAIAQLLRAWFGIDERDTQSEAAAKLRRGVDALDRRLAPGATALAALLDLSPQDPQWAALSPAQKRRRTLEVVSALVMRRSEARPLVLVVEDLHWSDPGTQAVVDHLIDGLGACRVLLVLTHRPEYRHASAARSHVTQIRLNPLGADSADRLLRALLGENAELRGLRRQLIDRTAGTPLFLEELVRALAQSGALAGRPGAYRAARPIDAEQIPSSVHAVIAARIDRLPAAQKSLLHTAAVIGQDVPLEQLQPIVDLDADTLHELLAGLHAAEFLYPSRSLPEPQFTFKHALIHRVAYEGVLRERRRVLHRRVLEMIEARYAGRLDEHVERLAHHALGAQERRKAVEYLYRSAGKALQRSAHQQAIRYLKQGIELIDALPDARDRLKRELDYRKTLGVAMMAAKGWAAEEVLDAYTRARALSEDLGDERELFIALRGEGQYRMIGGQSAIARRLGNRCIALAERSTDVGVQLEAHHLFWSNSFFMGEYAEAGRHCAKGVSLYERERDHALTFVYSGHDPGVCCRSFSALIDCLCGRPDRCLEGCREALALAQRFDHPLTTAIAYWAHALAHILRGEPLQARQWAERVIAVSDEYLLPLTRYQGILQLGWALTQLGELDEGIARMREGVEGTKATGAEMGLPYFVALLGEALGRAGRPDAGLEQIEHALVTAERNGARFQFSEMLRLKGELLATLSNARRKEAGACFRESIAAADEQGAKLPKLRSATSLARLLMTEGNAGTARVVLQSAYHAITEGHDTSDLKAAGALLAELGG
jgi:DNA-binding SARP family transcriptional activator/predicted ATPase